MQMVKIDSVFLLTLSDFLVNMAAAWVGAAFVIGTKTKKAKLRLLTMNIAYAIFCLITAYMLRKENL